MGAIQGGSRLPNVWILLKSFSTLGKVHLLKRPSRSAKKGYIQSLDLKSLSWQCVTAHQCTALNIASYFGLQVFLVASRLQCKPPRQPSNQFYQPKCAGFRSGGCLRVYFWGGLQEQLTHLLPTQFCGKWQKLLSTSLLMVTSRTQNFSASPQFCEVELAQFACHLLPCCSASRHHSSYTTPLSPIFFCSTLAPPLPLFFLLMKYLSKNFYKKVVFEDCPVACASWEIQGNAPGQSIRLALLGYVWSSNLLDWSDVQTLRKKLSQDGHGIALLIASHDYRKTRLLHYV